MSFMIFIFYLVFYVKPNTLLVILWRVVRRAEETGTYSWPRFCSVNCPPMVINYQLSHMGTRLGFKPWSEGWEASVLPLHHHGPNVIQKIFSIHVLYHLVFYSVCIDYVCYI